MKTTIKLYALILAMSPFLCNAQSVAAVERAVEKQDVKTSNAVIQAKKNAIDGKFSKSYTTANAEFIKSNSVARVNPEIAEKKNSETDKWQKANVPALKSKAENAKTSKMPKNIGKFADIKLNKEQKAELTKQTFKGIDKRMVVEKQLSKKDFQKTLPQRTAKQSMKKSSPNLTPPENYTLPFDPDMTNAETVWNIIDSNGDGEVSGDMVFGGWAQSTNGMKYLYNPDCVTAADDYLVTNAPVVIPAGDYVLTVSFENSGFTENVSILYGTTADVSSMTVLDDLEFNAASIYQKRYNLSDVISAGSYYFAVHCTSPADQNYIILSRFKIAEKPLVPDYYELPFNGNFSDSEYALMWNITDEDGDGSTWGPCSPSYAYPFEAGMIAAGNRHWNDEAPSNDWLITNAPVRVPAGDKTLEFAICASYNLYDETVEVLYGTTANTADMISLGTYTTNSVVWDKIKVLLNMAAGDYYFAVRNISSYGDNGMYLANLSITEGYTAPPTSYTLPYGEGFYWSFVHDWTVIDANNDGSSWQQRFINGNGEAYYQYSYSNAASDWLLLNKPVAIPAGDNNVGVVYSTINYPESFEVYYGTTQDVNSMTLLGGKYNVTLDGLIYKTLPLNFNVPAGDYYFAIKAVSEADQNVILIDSFYIATGSAPINPDLTITKIIKPQMGCSLTESEKLGVVISNQGTGASSQTVYIRYTVGSVTGTDTVQINILPDEEATYYLNAEFDFSVPDYYSLEVEVTDPDDLNIDDNTCYGSLYNKGVVELPYLNYLYSEDAALEFEWTGDDWVYFNVPDYGYKDITATKETPLLTHCFNVPAGTTHLSMDLGYMAGFSFFGFEDVDTFMIKVGKQGTDIETWSVVADLEGEQTYGDYKSKHFMFDVADGAGTYQIAIVPVYLSGLAVESVSIYATPQHDLTITDIILPVVACEVDSTESFGFVLKNLGYDTAMTYQVEYIISNSGLSIYNTYTVDFNTPIAPGETKTVYTVIAEKLVPSSNTYYYNYGVFGDVHLTGDENRGNDFTAEFLPFGVYTPIATPWVSDLYNSGDEFIGGPDVNDWFYSYYDGAMIAESYELPTPLKTRCIEISEAGHYMIMFGYFAGYEEYGLTADFTVKIGLSGTDIASWQTVATYSGIMSSTYTVDRLFVNLAAAGKYQIAVVPTRFSGGEFFMAVNGMGVAQAKAFDVSLNSAIKPSIDCEPGVEEFTVNLINMGYDTLKTLPLYIYGYNYGFTDYLPVTETYDTVILKNLNIPPGKSAGVKVPVDLSMMESLEYIILNATDTLAYYSPTMVYFTVDDEVMNNDLRNYNETYAYLGIFEPETMPFTPDLYNYGHNAEKYFANVMNIYDAELYGISSDKWILDHYNAFVYVVGLTLPEAVKTHCIQIDNTGNYLLELKYWAGLNNYGMTASVDVLIGKTGTDISSWTKLLEIRDKMSEDYSTVYSPVAISEAGLYQIAIVPKSFEGQSFYFDFAKLNLTVPAEHNIVLKSVNNPPSAYTPAKQLTGNTAISATVLNLGESTENVTVNVLKDNVSIANTVISGIKFSEEITVAVSANLAMQMGDNATFSVEASIEAEDLDTTDNIKSFAVTVTDSVFAKENLLGFDYGVGADAAVSFGNIYTLSVQDTLTSVSILFAEDAEAQEFGYSVYKILANGRLAAAPVISGTAESEVGLVTMYFSNSEVLEPGNYYVCIDQLGAIPAGVAFDTGNIGDVFYVKAENLLAPVSEMGSLAIRANVGKASLNTAIEVNNLGKQSKLNVYTQNRELYIAAKESMKNVSLMNVQGVTVMKSGNINSDNYKFNVQNLASGIYFVRVQMGSELKNVKVIIY